MRPGKSNLLDIFRFLRDIAKVEGGGFQKAVKDRGGVSKIRSLAARRDPEVTIEIHPCGQFRTPLQFGNMDSDFVKKCVDTVVPISLMRVCGKNGEQLLSRPNAEDEKDMDRRTQTFLEQINVNADFREVARFLQAITYLHLVPQLLRFADSIQGRIVEDDPFGQGFLERVASVPEKNPPFTPKKNRTSSQNCCAST